uniref:NADH-ubiquinone oxidoreductase chain 4L n=1 Tax=Phatnoma laciniatum TaxID=1964415 RepID=A0A343BTA0_9HEMI|nr:NADH dehydrogenase subunit 4L [Phatnoma laciniatum]ARB50165.1 NADH dehydrogenase subunit 4L [Phatnoma laciniatum]
MKTMIYMVFYSLFCGFLMFSFSHDHLLLTLMSLEFLVVTMFLLMTCYLMYWGLELYFLIIFLSFSVCEGSVGLSLLVCVIRGHGNDMISSLSLIQW